MTQADRHRILERRALFISAALSALSCGGAAAQGKEPGSAVAIEPPAPAESASPAAPPAREEPDPAAPPDIVVPADASETAVRMYDSLKRQVTRVQIDLAELSRVMLNCSITECGGDKETTRIAKLYSSTRHSVKELAPLCPGSSEHGKRDQEVVQQQQAFFGAKLERYRADFVKRLGDASRFEAALATADSSLPMVCLDCGDW